MDKITTGLRPEWSSNNLSQKLLDALWEHIEAFWNQEPKERPTVLEVLQTLLALGEGGHYEPVVSVENSEDDVTEREREEVEDTPDSMFVLAVVAWGLTLVGLQFPSPTSDLVVHAGVVYSGVFSARRLRNACPAPHTRRNTYWEQRRRRQLEHLSYLLKSPHRESKPSTNVKRPPFVTTTFLAPSKRNTGGP